MGTCISAAVGSDAERVTVADEQRCVPVPPGMLSFVATAVTTAPCCLVVSQLRIATRV